MPNSISFTDPIYGPAGITEPVLLALVESAGMQRLQGVLQHGVTALIGVTASTTRFEHSLGVMLLVQRLGASLTEQIAALLHDVSHTAFSHVIDYVFERHVEQGYHEEHKAAHIAASDLPAILAEYGYNWRDFLSDDSFPLLEQPAPALCADRLDYFWRDSLPLGLTTAAEIQQALTHLTVCQGRIAVTDLDVARWLGYTYIATDQASWANLREVALYELAAQAIRRGLREGVISEADLWGTDQQVWDKLKASTDPALQAPLRRVSPQARFTWDETAPTLRVRTKLRTLDPDLCRGGQLQPLSSLDLAFARHRQDYLDSKAGLWPIRVWD